MPRPAAADLIPPPTLVADTFQFGPAMGLILTIALLTSVVLLYRRMRWAGKGRLATSMVCILLFLGVNLICYLLALGGRRPHGPPIPVPAQPPAESNR